VKNRSDGEDEEEGVSGYWTTLNKPESESARSYSVKGMLQKTL